MLSKEEAFKRLENSPFRSRFHLTKKDLDYIEKNGMEKIRSHAMDFVNSRIRIYDETKDGKQTPMSSHPVFKAQHATAFCCRGCMEKWYGIPKTQTLTDDQVERIANFLMAWIEKEKKEKEQ